MTAPSEWPTVARDAERRVVVDGVVDGDVRGVVVSGGSGVGRTQLARAAVALASERGLRTAWASAAAATSEIPLGALAHLVPSAPGDASPAR